MSVNRFSLKGKVALITGGSRGIGRAIALAFAEAGADVAVSSRKLPELEQVAAEIRKKGGKSLALICHVGRPDDIKNLVERIKNEWGGVNILVNNAGTNPYYGPLLEAEERAWDVTMNVNLKGPFLLSQLVARAMREQRGGSIINIASTEGISPADLNIYSVTKAGLIMLTRVMAKEWGQYGIRVNAIAPGLIRTRFSEALWKEPAKGEAAARSKALGYLGSPEDITGAALYLASDASGYVTGETIIVDGGESVGPPPVFPT